MSMLDLIVSIKSDCGYENTRGKSELHRAGCQITSGEGDLRESAIEKKTAMVTW